MRHLFGDGPADFAVSLNASNLRVLGNATGTAWTAKTGGSQLTDLQTATGEGATVITSGADGRIAFYGPDSVTSLWVDFGQGRFQMEAESGAGALPPTGYTGPVDLSGAASVTLPPGTGATRAQRVIIDTRLRRATIGLQVHAADGQDDTADHFDAYRTWEADTGADVDEYSFYMTVNSTADYDGATKYTAAVGAQLAADPDRDIFLVLENFCDHPGTDGNLQATITALANPANQFTVNLTALADAIVAAGHMSRLVIAPMHECNGGGGYPWQIYANTGETNPNTSARYIQAFQAIVALMRARGVTARFCQWFLTANSASSLTDYATHYVTDDYCDEIGLTYYNRCGLTSGYSYWEALGHNLADPLQMIVEMTGRPVRICESSCVKETTDNTKAWYGESKAEWLEGAIDCVGSGAWERVQHLTLFMVDASDTETTRDWRLQTADQKAAVARAVRRLRNPRADRPAGPAYTWSPNLLPPRVEYPTATTPFSVSGTGVSMAADTQQPPRLPPGTGSIKVTRTAEAAGTPTSQSLRYIVPSNAIYTPGKPYTLSFYARASVAGLILSAGIRQTNSPNTFIGQDNIHLRTGWQLYRVPVQSATTEQGAWRVFFGIGANSLAGSIYVTGLRFAAGMDASTPVDSIARAERVTALTDGATITPVADTTDIATVTLGGNRTLATPTGTPTDGQKLILRAKQDATGSRTLTLASGYSDPAGLLSLTTTAAKTDRLTFEYDAALAKWCLIGIVKGF